VEGPGVLYVAECRGQPKPGRCGSAEAPVDAVSRYRLDSLNAGTSNDSQGKKQVTNYSEVVCTLQGRLKCRNFEGLPLAVLVPRPI